VSKIHITSTPIQTFHQDQGCSNSTIVQAAIMICVHCGSKVEKLYDIHRGDLRLTVCPHCHNTADPYVEFEIIIVMIDMLLMRRAAYRHVLVNSTSDFPLAFLLPLFLATILLETVLHAWSTAADASVNTHMHVERWYDRPRHAISLLLGYSALFGVLKAVEPHLQLRHFCIGMLGKAAYLLCMIWSYPLELFSTLVNVFVCAALTVIVSVVGETPLVRAALGVVLAVGVQRIVFFLGTLV
jgi:hypothetical protein